MVFQNKEELIGIEVTGLPVTKDMLKQAYGQNAAGWCERFSARAFLNLTTGSDADIQDFMNTALPLADYVEFIRTGESILMPFLKVDVGGRIIGHEGRNRAAALLKAGVETMPVAIIVCKDGHSISVGLPRPLPTVFINQYDETRYRYGVQPDEVGYQPLA